MKHQGAPITPRLSMKNCYAAQDGEPARPTMLMGTGIAWVSLPIVSASVTAKGKTQSAPAAK